MIAYRPHVPSSTSARALRELPPAPASFHAPRRARDFGVGYGASSGYVSRERYTREWGEARFRFA